MSAQPIYLVPAPDMDERAVRSIQIEGREVVALKLEPLHRDTDLEALLTNLKSQIAHERPTLLGFCYGGILALELAKRMEVERVTLVSSVKHHREIAPSRKLLARIYCALPDWPLRTLGAATTFIVNDILRIKVHIPRVWQKGEQNKFLLKHALAFEGVGPELAITHIHGECDAVIPANSLEAAYIIEGGGHFLFLNKRKELLLQLSKV